MISSFKKAGLGSVKSLVPVDFGERVKESQYCSDSKYNKSTNRE